jgi:predicted nucleic acid-binding protein
MAHRFDTEQLKLLRQLLDKHASLKSTIGEIFQFRLVVDANFVIAVLIRRVRYPEQKQTALEELVKATIFEVFAPRWLETEMISTIPKVAERRKLSEEALWEQWQMYQRLLKWDDTYSLPPKKVELAVDPKDVPYVMLEKALEADGILSRDKDISEMGGNALTMNFVLSARNYARATVVTVGIRVFGTMVGAIGLQVLVEMLRGVGKGVGKLPNGLKLAILIGLVVVIAHPGARKWVAERLRVLVTAIDPLLSGVHDILVEGAKLSQENRLAAAAHLIEAKKAMANITQRSKTGSRDSAYSGKVRKLRVDQ